MIEVERRGAIRIITLARPERSNASVPTPWRRPLVWGGLAGGSGEADVAG